MQPTRHHWHHYFAPLKKPLEIHWTGYSEPLLNNSFIEMSELTESYGIPQEISTTLAGLDRNIDYLAQAESFYLIVLHLPDSEGMMMKGMLKVDDIYVQRLRNFLSLRLASSTTPIRVICFGSQIHPSIQKVLYEFQDSPSLTVPAPLLDLATRCGSAPKSVKPIKTKRDQDLVISKSIVKSILRRLTIPVYMCRDKKLFQPVLLGNYHLNICCMDYSLSMQRGSLDSRSLSEIDDDWWQEVRSDFASGQSKPCSSCENYVKADLLSILSEVRNFTKLLLRAALSLASQRSF